MERAKKAFNAIYFGGTVRLFNIMISGWIFGESKQKFIQCQKEEYKEEIDFLAKS